MKELHRKDPASHSCPRVMRCRPRGLQRSVDRGSRRRGIEPRNTRTRISPLLANLYMRHFLLGRKQAGWDRKLRAHIVNYADDFVILCRATAESARAAMMGKLRLKVNQQKTRVLSSAQRIVRFFWATRWAGVIGRKQEKPTLVPSPRRRGWHESVTRSVR
jgi:RNA-directed DNA polymerase